MMARRKKETDITAQKVTAETSARLKERPRIEQQKCNFSRKQTNKQTNL
ncbi:hypothetical protein PMV43_00940 [Enterococcus casseliflavus]|nr:hypothetical protein [Enterococcus casseliflavus]